MDATFAHVELDGIRLADWIEQAGISRSTAYELLKLLGIEPEARRVPTSRKPVSHLSGEQIEQLLPWVQEVQRGATLPQIRDRLGRNQTVPDDRPGQLDTIPDNSPGQNQIVPVDLRSGTSGQARSVGFAQVLDVKAITLPGW
jgi:hypothetical protein